jgi:hypothetical protein
MKILLFNQNLFFLSCVQLSECRCHCARVARWFVFKPKIQIWVNFVAPYIDWKNVDAHVFYGHLEYFKDIWENLMTIGYFCADLVNFGITSQQNLATLIRANRCETNLKMFQARTEQGCQIFRGTKYQNDINYTKLPRTNQMSTKYNKRS